jgi:hypothetical protein
MGETAMTGAERQAQHRTTHANGAPVIRVRHRNDTIVALTDLQTGYAAWLDALADNQRDSATAEALQAIVGLDLSELQAIEPPRGFGRD